MDLSAVSPTTYSLLGVAALLIAMAELTPGTSRAHHNWRAATYGAAIVLVTAALLLSAV